MAKTGTYSIGQLRLRLPRRRYRGWSMLPEHSRKEMFGLNIGPFPGRKRVALYANAGPVSIPLAYFRSPVHAQLTMVLLESLITRRLPEPVQEEETKS